MATLTIPNTFTAATTLDAAKLDENFAAVRTFLNGSIVNNVATGLDSTNLDTSNCRIGLSQQAQNKSLSIVALGIATPSSATNAQLRTSLYCAEATDVIGVRCGILRTNSSPASVTVIVQPGDSNAGLQQSTPTTGIVYDEAVENNWGDMRPPSGGPVRIPKGGTLYLYASGASANIAFLNIQVKLATYLTNGGG